MEKIYLTHEEIFEKAKKFKTEFLDYVPNAYTKDTVKLLKEFCDELKFTTPHNPNDQEFIFSLINIVNSCDGYAMVKKASDIFDIYLSRVTDDNEINDKFNKLLLDMKSMIKKPFPEYKKELLPGSELHKRILDIFDHSNNNEAINEWCWRLSDVIEDDKIDINSKDALFKSMIHYYLDQNNEKQSETVVPMDKLAKQIQNKKNINANNVDFTILSKMMDLVVNSTDKLVGNIEEEDYSNIRDKMIVNRELSTLVNSYSNILEILGEYYVKLER